MKLPFVIYADLECVLKKIHSFQSDPEKTYTRKKRWTYTLWLFIVYTMFIWWKKLKKKKKIRLVLIKVKIVWKTFVGISENI